MLISNKFTLRAFQLELFESSVHFSVTNVFFLSPQSQVPGSYTQLCCQTPLLTSFMQYLRLFNM